VRKRRRTRYTWLPNLGQEVSTTEPSEFLSNFNLGLTAPADGGQEVGVTPLIYDFVQEQDDITAEFASLNFLIGNEYLLRRVVGKIHVAYAWFIQTGVGTTIPASEVLAVQCTVGLFVARAGDVSDGTGGNGPIGSQAAGIAVRNYNPQARDCIREPWLWRRQWVLGTGIDNAGQANDVSGNPRIANGNFHDSRGFPATNAHYGSVADGPHIDAKTLRRVGQNDRLWLAATVNYYPPNTQQVNANIPQGVTINVDLRFLGALRKAKNRGVF